MSAAPLRLVRVASLRVALITTAIVAVLYAAIAASVVVIVTRNLTADIDNRLTSSLANLHYEPSSGVLEGYDARPPGDTRITTPVLIWVVGPDGTVASNTPNATLAATDRDISEPRTIKLGGVDVRAAGARLGSAHVVVGQTMESVLTARNNLMLAELLVGPVLLVLVFAGALTIGRRVATPIELARQRQLEFTGNASHELRTPLSVIEAQATLALSAEREVAWYRAAFERVNIESKRMRRLVDDLLWLARFDASRAQPESEPVDVGLLAQQAVDRFVAVAETRGQRMGLEVSGDSNVVRAPADWLDHLAGVLIDNACRYTPDGGNIVVRVSSNADRVRLTVDDSGTGIPPGARTRIFDRFQRASENPGGSGLGLAIANAIVLATGGIWDIGSSPEGGASMRVSWPPAFARHGRVPAGPGGAVIQPTGTPAQG